MEKSNSYANGMLYETFIRRAFKQYDREKNGAGSENMTNLIDAEKKASWVSHLPKFEKQFPIVKNFINNAINNILLWNLTEEERKILVAQKEKLIQAADSSSLIEVINDSLDATQRFKEF